MNKPGQGFYKEGAERKAIKMCHLLRVPTEGYDRWKELQLNFDAREMLEDDEKIKIFNSFIYYFSNQHSIN